MKNFSLDCKEVLVLSTRKGWINYWGEENENRENLREFENSEEAWEYINEKGLNDVNSDYCRMGTLIKISLKIKDKIVRTIYTSLCCFEEDFEETFKKILKEDFKMIKLIELY